MGTVADMRGRGGSRTDITLGVLAHHAMKEELVRFMRAHRRLLAGFRFLAPEDTARALDEVGLRIESLAPGAMGGDIQVGAAVVEGRVDAVIFLYDPLAGLACEPDVRVIMKVCDVERVPVATNVASAEILVHHLGDMTRFSDPPDMQEVEQSQGEPGVERVLSLLPGPGAREEL